MPRAYCTKSDVAQWLPDNLTLEGENPSPDPFDREPENATNSDLDFWIQQACQDIDSTLASQYDTPLRPVNQGGEVGYPHPIPEICAALAAEKIWGKYLQAGDRQRSESQKEREEWAHNTLRRIQNGEVRLMGQRATRGSRYIRSTALDIPKNPAEGGRSRQD